MSRRNTIMNTETDHLCEMCEGTDRPVALFECKECRKYICVSCRKKHDEFTRGTFHDVIKLEAAYRNVNSDSTNRRSSNSINAVRQCELHGKSFDYYCRDCKKEICIKCNREAHSVHTVEYIDDIQEEVRQKLSDQVKFLNEGVKTLKEHSNAAEQKAVHVNEFREKGCIAVDEHVRRICSTVKEIGNQLCGEIKAVCNTEKEKIVNYAEKNIDVKRKLKQLESDSCESLENKQFGQLIKIVNRNESEISILRGKLFRMPNIRTVNFNCGRIDEESLRNSLGKVQYLETIDLEKTLIKHPSRSLHMQQDFQLDEFQKKFGVHYSGYYYLKDLEWRFGVLKRSEWSLADLHIDKGNATLQISIFVDNEGFAKELKGFSSCIASVNMKLVNKQNDNNSIEINENGHRFAPGYTAFTRSRVIDWDTLSNRRNGFVDKNNSFRIEIEIEILSLIR